MKQDIWPVWTSIMHESPINRPAFTRNWPLILIYKCLSVDQFSGLESQLTYRMGFKLGPMDVPIGDTVTHHKCDM